MECQFCTDNLATVSVMHNRDKIEQAACNACENKLPNDKWTVVWEFDISAWDYAG